MHECKNQIAIEKHTVRARTKFEHMLNMHNGMYKANKKKQ